MIHATFQPADVPSPWQPLWRWGYVLTFPAWLVLGLIVMVVLWLDQALIHPEETPHAS